MPRSMSAVHSENITMRMVNHRHFYTDFDNQFVDARDISLVAILTRMSILNIPQNLSLSTKEFASSTGIHPSDPK